VASLDLLGYRLSCGELQPDPSRLQPLLTLQPPSSPEGLKRITGLFAYYSKWIKDFSKKARPLQSASTFPLGRGGSSTRAAALAEKYKAKDSAKRLKFGFSYENFTTQSFSVLPTPFRLNVSNNVSLLANDTTYAMTFSAHLPMNLAISGLSPAEP